MADTDVETTQPLSMRTPSDVMRLERLGSFHQTRLSFMRGLLRRVISEGWQFSRPVWRVDGNGVGVAVYQAKGPKRAYSLVCFAHDLDPAKRSDRSIATEWDATFAMFDGIPTEQDLDRLSQQVPKQEAGRVSESELSLSRANRSVRLFEHVLSRLAEGRQPDTDQILKVGYLMRTTAVYGSGKFGAAARDTLKSRPETSRPFQIEMLSVYLTRAFSIDIVEHLAASRAPDTAVPLDRRIARRLGVGNSTGLGMAPFLVNHPRLVHNWINARETSLARVRAQEHATTETIAQFHAALNAAAASIAKWRTVDQDQAKRIAELCQDIETLQAHLKESNLASDFPWERLFQWGMTNLETEAQELLVSLLIEPHGALVDDLLDTMSADTSLPVKVDGAMRVSTLNTLLQTHYAWVERFDFDATDARQNFWYVSETKGEPRLSPRSIDPDADRYETPLDIACQVSRLKADMAAWPDEGLVARFLLANPEHRSIVRRVQGLVDCPYSEIQENLVADGIRPVDMMRCKLSFFGATDFDPRSDLWIRITMFKNAPYPDELTSQTPDDWVYSAEDLKA